MLHADPTELFASLMLGASETIDLLLRMGVGFVNTYESNEQFALIDQRLRLRCILTTPDASLRKDLTKEERLYYDQLYRESLAKLKSFGWGVRVVDRKPSINCLIVDRSQVLLADLPKADWAPREHQYLVSEGGLVGTIQDHFDKLWDGVETLDFVYEDLLASSIPDLANKIIVASKKCWDRMIAYLMEHPQDLYAMHPRNFEELVAELLIREGMKIELTQESKDGGRDILAWTETAAGSHLYLVECKRYGPNKPVGVSLVRALYGVVTKENATGGLLVTTSRFTRGARAFQQAVQNRIWLKDYNALLEWLEKM